MLLGKRSRPHIRRTTSMTAFTSNVDMLDSSHDHDHDHNKETSITNNNHVTTSGSSTSHGYVGISNNSNYYDDHGRFLASMVLSPRNIQRTNSYSSSGLGFVIEPASFLRTCGLCTRRLAPATDIYIYRGDTAFCSQECREKRMEQDEKKEKYKEVIMATKREEHSSRNSKTSSSKGQTLATA